MGSSFHEAASPWKAHLQTATGLAGSAAWARDFPASAQGEDVTGISISLAEPVLKHGARLEPSWRAREGPGASKNKSKNTFPAGFSLIIEFPLALQHAALFETKTQQLIPGAREGGRGDVSWPLQLEWQQHRGKCHPNHRQIFPKSRGKHTFHVSAIRRRFKRELKPQTDLLRHHQTPNFCGVGRVRAGPWLWGPTWGSEEPP